MSFILNLFSITVLNNFYKSKTDKDFEIVPTLETQNWLKKQNVRIVKYTNTIDLIWLAENHDNPLETFQNKTHGITWSFIMTLNNKSMLNLCDLETGYATNQVYYFHNRHKHGKKTLHQGDYVSAMDLEAIPKVNHYPTELGWDVFAIIDIDLDQWAKLEQANQHTRSLLKPYPYEIHIQSRSTFWRYYFIDTHKKLSKTMKILAKDGSCYFNNVTVETDRPKIYSIEANKPIRLCDQYDYYFSLYKSDKDYSESKEKILLEHLPYPKYDSIKQDKYNQKKYYSDIVVHI